MITLKPLLKVFDDESDIEIINNANFHYVFTGMVKMYKGRSYRVINIAILNNDSYRIIVHVPDKARIKTEKYLKLRGDIQ